MNLKYEVGQKVPVIHSTPVSGMEEIKSITVGPKGAKYSTLKGAYTEAELDAFTANFMNKPAEDKPKFQRNGKVKCISEREGENHFTTGKIYEIDALGSITADNGFSFNCCRFNTAAEWLEDARAATFEPVPSFDWDAFKAGKIAVHCDTEEKAKEFEALAKSKGLTWRIRETAQSAFARYTKHLCFASFENTGKFHFQIATEQYYKDHSISIIDYPFSEQPEPEKPIMVTIDILEKLGACNPGKAAFQRYFPDGGEFNAVWNKAMEISRRADADWLNNRREEIETMQDKLEPIKLYCVKDAGIFVSVKAGDIITIDTNGIFRDRNGLTSGPYKSWDDFKWQNPDISACLVPLVKRPAKVGEYVPLDRDDCMGKNKKGGIAEVINIFGEGMSIKDPTGEYQNGIHMSFPAYTYVLDGYHPEPEAEDEWNSKYGYVVAKFIEFKGEAHADA